MRKITPTKRGRGRPKVDPSVYRGEKVTIRFTESERKQLEQAAGHIQLSDWVRSVTLANCKKPTPPPRRMRSAKLAEVSRPLGDE